MAYDKCHNLNNLDECVQNKFLNVGTGKLHVKNNMEKWGGLEVKSLGILLLLLLLSSSFMFVFFALNGSLLFFSLFIKTHCKYYFEFFFYVTFVFIHLCCSLGLI